MMIDGIEWSALSLGKGPMAPVGQEAVWNSRGTVEGRDTRKSAGLCWVSNLNTSVQPVAVVRVSRVAVYGGKL
jgi:hypothetical protein